MHEHNMAYGYPYASCLCTSPMAFGPTARLPNEDVLLRNQGKGPHRMLLSLQSHRRSDYGVEQFEYERCVWNIIQ